MRTVLVILLAIATTSSANKKVVCYYESRAAYRSDEGKYLIEDINAELCTHVVYSSVGIRTSGEIESLDDAEELTRFSRFVKSRGAKALISVGGANEDPAKFSTVANDLGTRTTFVQSAITLLDRHGLDGLDVHWEYPNSGTGTHEYDKENFVTLLKELKDAFAPKGYILSAAVSASLLSFRTSYIVPEIGKILDLINVMAYNLNGDLNSLTELNAPLYSSPIENSLVNVEVSIDYWIHSGAPAEKIIMGIPFFGRSFTLRDPNKHDLYAPAVGNGEAGPYTQKSGYIGYNELCLHFKTGTWTIVRAEAQRVPFMYNENQWISYDDVWSINQKVDFIKSKNLGGAMVWTIDNDDFRGVCGSKHPLLSAVHDGLND